MIPMFINEYHNGHDTMYHVTNITELKNQVKENFFFTSNIVGDIANNYGYGSNLFYPPLGHLVPAYMDLAINNITTSLKIVHFLTLFISGTSMYFL